jgi:sulfur carrier protein
VNDPAPKTNATIPITVNGAPRDVPAGATLARALLLLSAPREGFAVEVNGRIVPRSEHATTILARGDRLEIVTFVGGG